MRILMIGDVVGRPGRRAVHQFVPALRSELGLDLVTANGENSAAGFGITQSTAQELLDSGVDVITTGNHVWDRREIIDYIDGDPRLLRPMNYPAGTPGRGVGVFDAPGGRRIVVIHPMGRLYMDPLDDPFKAVEAALADHRLGDTVHCILVDVHAETTSEKAAMGQFLDGRVSMVTGTHTHVPTADTRILPGGTAYQTDLGMCGDYDSVIGMKKEAAIGRFLEEDSPGRLEPATGEATLCAVFLETDDETGLARHVAPLRTGGHLAETWPE